MLGAAGVTLGAMTRGAPEVWPVVVPEVELLVAGLELLTALRSLLPHGPNSISAAAIATAAIIAVMVPVPIPVLRLSSPVRSIGVRVLDSIRSLRPGWLSRLLISLVLQKLNEKNLSVIELFQRKRRVRRQYPETRRCADGAPNRLWTHKWGVAWR